MELIQWLVASIVLVSFAHSTYVHQRIAGSRLNPIEATNSVDHEQSSSVKKETNRDTPSVPTIILPGISFYPPALFAPVRVEGHNTHVQTNQHGNTGAFGASGSLIVPGLHLNLGGSNVFGGSLSASGGFSGFYGPHGHGHGGASAYAGSLVSPVHYGHYGSPYHYGYPVHHIGAGGYAGAGGFSPFYAGSHGIYHKTSETQALGENPNGPLLQGVAPNQYKQPEAVFEVSPYQEGEQENGLPPGFHHPGFIASNAGRLGYPVLMASPEQLQDLSFRQNPNPFAQFFQRPFQALQMFIRPQNNGSKQPEKPETQKPVADSSAAGRPAADKPVEVNPKPNSDKPTSQSHSATPVKVQTKQNTTAPAGPQKKPTGSAVNIPTPADKNKKEKPRPSLSAPSAVSDVIASVNEVVKASTAVNAGSAPVLPVFIEEASAKSRLGDDVTPALDETEANTDTSANIVPSDESAIDLESKPTN